jgi:hypothetical protein
MCILKLWPGHVLFDHKELTLANVSESLPKEADSLLINQWISRRPWNKESWSLESFVG